jgi:hypothetical protein
MSDDIRIIFRECVCVSSWNVMTQEKRLQLMLEAGSAKHHLRQLGSR